MMTSQTSGMYGKSWAGTPMMKGVGAWMKSSNQRDSTGM